jgi:uncharacterized protein YciW
MEDIFNSILLKSVGITGDHPLASVLSGRSEIMRLTQTSMDAVLQPEPPGGLCHSERAALACRIARLNDEEQMASYYEAMIPENSEFRAIADPAFVELHDQRLKAILRYTDLVTVDPKRATESDILALKAAGILEADIVRLSELIAFLSYQMRVVQGLRLMRDAA